MAQIKSEILEIIQKYVKLLEDKGFPVKTVYLYGSYASGNETEMSDIDLGIVSNKFDGNRFLDKSKIRGLYRKIDLRLSTYPLIEEDLQNNPFVFHEIVKKGIRII